MQKLNEAHSLWLTGEAVYQLNEAHSLWLTGEAVYQLNEASVCRFYAELLLRTADKVTSLSCNSTSRSAL